MKKVLIAFNDLNHSKYVFNLISLKYGNELQVFGISTSCEETISLFFKFYPDIIFIDSTLYLELRQKLFSEYEPLYYINDESKLMHNNSYIISYLNISDSFKNLIFKFKETQKQSINNKIHLKALKCLQDLNFNFKQIGTQYFLEAVIYAYENKNTHVLNNIKKYIYPGISNKYHTSIDKVKWNIEKSINSMYKYNTSIFPGLIEEYLNFDFMQKPTTKELLILINRTL